MAHSVQRAGEEAPCEYEGPRGGARWNTRCQSLPAATGRCCLLLSCDLICLLLVCLFVCLFAIYIAALLGLYCVLFMHVWVTAHREEKLLCENEM